MTFGSERSCPSNLSNTDAEEEIKKSSVEVSREGDRHDAFRTWTLPCKMRIIQPSRGCVSIS